jgi:hypothetical protein
MDLQYGGRVAIVTGVSHGIGWSTANLLLHEGAKVVGISRTLPDRELPGLHHARADVLDDATPARAADHALSEFGRLDVLVNNAGTGRIREGYQGVTNDQWRETFDLLFLSVVRMTSTALPALLASSAGVVVNVSTRIARVPVAAVPDYESLPSRRVLPRHRCGSARTERPFTSRHWRGRTSNPSLNRPSRVCRIAGWSEQTKSLTSSCIWRAPEPEASGASTS